MKKIWVFHHYATLPNMNGHLRPYNFGRNLKKYDVNMTIFSASYQHFSDTNIIEDNRDYVINSEFEIPYVFINTTSSKSGALSRVKNMMQFYFRLFKVSKKYVALYGRPDMIIASSPHPLTMLAGIQIAKKFKVPCICEVRDLWPEAIFAASNVKKESLFGKLMTLGEYRIYKKADAIIFTKEGDVDYIKEKGWNKLNGKGINLKKCFYINNGVNLDLFNVGVDENKVEDPDLNNKKFNVIYTGAIRPVNNVGNILDAAKLLKNETDIHFLIYGDGNQVDQLKQRIIDEEINNVSIKGYIEKRHIPFVLSRSGVNILNYSQEKYNWTRGNSSNKLFEYMASGKPIISTVKMNYCIIDKYKCGFSLKENTPKALADEIVKVKQLSVEEYNKLCNNAKAGAAEFDYDVLTERLMKVINTVMVKR